VRNSGDRRRAARRRRRKLERPAKTQIQTPPSLRFPHPTAEFYTSQSNRRRPPEFSPEMQRPRGLDLAKGTVERVALRRVKDAGKDNVDDVFNKYFADSMKIFNTDWTTLFRWL
jgi:hypothetical protein